MLHSREAVWAVVTPVYEDGESFAALCRDLAGIEAGAVLEILAVDDGTIAAPPAIDAVREAGLAGRIVRLRRNCGHQTAVWVGLAVAASEPRYTGAIVMDSDGEDRPEDIGRLIGAIGPDCDAAAARRGRRTESLPFRLFYRLYRGFLRPDDRPGNPVRQFLRPQSAGSAAPHGHAGNPASPCRRAHQVPAAAHGNRMRPRRAI